MIGSKAVSQMMQKKKKKKWLEHDPVNLHHNNIPKYRKVAILPGTWNNIVKVFAGEVIFHNTNYIDAESKI